MSLAMNVEQHHKLMYSDNVVMVAQQLKNPLQGMVTEVACTGEAKSVADLVNQLEYEYGEERTRRNSENPASGSRRWLVFPPEIKSGQYIDREDKFLTATDPTGVYVRAHTAAVTRGVGDRILGIRKSGSQFEVVDGGILGKAREGKTPGVGAALPSGQYMPVGTTGLTLDKLRLAVKTLNLADWGMEDNQDELYCAITPYQTDDLLAIAIATGTALNAFQVDQIKEGKPTKLMGINWRFMNRLPKDGAGSRLCPVWAKRNIIAGFWEQIHGAMWNDTHADNLPYAKVSARLDCVRAEDSGVIVIECKEG